MEPGERLEFSVRWMGVEAGRAWAQVVAAADPAHPDAVRVEAGARNARLLDALYPIDDTLSSLWSLAGGTTEHRASYSEGSYRQKQLMRFGPTEVVVTRDHWRDGHWVTWDRTYRGEPRLDDPLTAVMRLRAEPPAPGGTSTLRVFNGKRILTLTARADTPETIDGQLARPIVVTSAREGDYEGRVRLWLSEDADAVPLRAAVDTRAGAVWMHLSSRVDPTP